MDTAVIRVTFKKSTARQIFKTAFSFIVGFGLGFLLSWIGAVLLTTVSHLRYNPINDAVLSSDLIHQFDSHENSILDTRSEYPQILCYFLVDPPTHKGAHHVKNTWAQRCDKAIFFSTKTDPMLEPVVLNVTVGYKYLWEKSKAALKYLHHHHPTYDWFLKADDDTYIIVENLRYFLREKDPTEPTYFGVKFKKHVDQGYMSGGGGYALSNEALKRFVGSALHINNQTLCPNLEKTGAEDLNIGMCLQAVGVSAGESLDKDGKPRFFSHSPVALLYKVPLINHLHWYWKYIWHKHTVGPDCCSHHLISFHNVDPRMMWTLEFLLYRMKIHRDMQPPNRNYSTSTLSPQDMKSSSVSLSSLIDTHYLSYTTHSHPDNIENRHNSSQSYMTKDINKTIYNIPHDSNSVLIAKLKK